MGYWSDVVIAIHKQALITGLLTDVALPKLLREYERFEHGDVYYWVFSGWKWYDGYPEVDEVSRYFEALSELPEIQHEGYTAPCFGAIRMGEDNTDVVEWGDPGEYHIQVERIISRPVEGISG